MSQTTYDLGKFLRKSRACTAGCSNLSLQSLGNVKRRINTMILQVIKLHEELNWKRFHTDLMLLMYSVYFPCDP